MRKMVHMTGLSVLFAMLLVSGCAATPSTPAGMNQTVHNTTNTNREVDVFYAGSLSKVMTARIAPGFTHSTGISFVGQGQGSEGLAEQIKNRLARPDVFISASPVVNLPLMKGKQSAIAGYFTLATDELVIAYSPRSRFETQLAKAKHGQMPWWRVLELPGFRLGRTDPETDPKGINTLLMLKLAQMATKQTDFMQRITHNQSPSEVFPEESLLARLTSGQLDAVIAYRHEAVEWGVPYIRLPEDINLGDVKKAHHYRQAVVHLANGQSVSGAPIVFTVALLKEAPHQSAAVRFIRSLLTGPAHNALMAEGLLPTSVTFTGKPSELPPALQGLAKP